jgi:sigma54-dependent transcription regulator
VPIPLFTEHELAEASITSSDSSLNPGAEGRASPAHEDARTRRPDCEGGVRLRSAESALFGSVRGAYTGAVSERMGLVESPRGGTLLFDETAELSVAAQIRLLRVLGSGMVRQVGDTAGRHVELRLALCIQQAATEVVAGKRWREGFYCRVADVSLTVPPLEERPSDVALLVNHYLLQLGHVPRDSSTESTVRWESRRRGRDEGAYATLAAGSRTGGSSTAPGWTIPCWATSAVR